MKRGTAAMAVLAAFVAAPLYTVSAQEPDDLEPAVSFDDTGDPEPAVTFDEPAAAEPAPVAEPPPVQPSDISPAVTSRPQAEGRAMDTLILEGTSITGNSELPKVMVIVPWKKSDLGDLVGRPVNSLLDEILSPVDRTVFQRHLRYYNDLYNPEADASDFE